MRLPPALTAPLTNGARERFEALPRGSSEELTQILSADGASRVLALSCGQLAVMRGDTRTGVSVPVLGYLLDSPAGLMVVDCGLAPRWREGGQVAGAPGTEGPDAPGATKSRYLPELRGPTMSEHLATVGLAPTRLVCTHLHLDHSGDAAALGLPVEATPAELAALAAGSKGYAPADLGDAGTVPVELDSARPLGPFAASRVLGEGVIAVDTAGHSAGSMSLLVCLGAMWGLICGDAVYPRLEEPDSDAYLAMLRVRRLIEDVPGVVVLAAHDTALQRTCADGSWLGAPVPQWD